ncbi:MAG TPA: PKD domain-containing protein [Candidatus Saccharimonadales bacterium]
MRLHKFLTPSVLALFGVLACIVFADAPKVLAADPPVNPQNGAIGIEGKIPSEPPKTAATITTPSNGQSFTNIPITVNGLCTKGLMVKIFSNNVFVGSVYCEDGSYSIQIDLFSGRNDLVARVFDSFDQAGPDSNVVTVTFNDAQFNLFGTSSLSLTSIFARRGANPGQTLTWPIILAGGAGPYAISVDWGDGKSADLISTEFTGTIDLSHVYTSAGIYRVIVRATDKNGLTAYLQLVAVANGAVSSDAQKAEDEGCAVITKVLWVPAVISIPLIIASFWLGRRYELAALRKHLERIK